MARKASGKPKRNIWTDTTSPYGQYTDGIPGSPEQWRQAFNERFTSDQIKTILDTDSPFTILGITSQATLAEIKAAYYKLIKTHHPDKGGDVKMAQKIIAAYQHLTN